MVISFFLDKILTSLIIFNLSISLLFDINIKKASCLKLDAFLSFYSQFL